MKTAAILLATLALLGCGQEKSGGKRQGSDQQVDGPSLPKASMIAKIEELASNSVVASDYDHTVHLRNIATFGRYYAFTTQGGRPFVWGELYPAGPSGLHIVHKSEVRHIFDGGCSAVSLFYDIKAAKIVSVQCHGLA